MNKNFKLLILMTTLVSTSIYSFEENEQKVCKSTSPKAFKIYPQKKDWKLSLSTNGEIDKSVFINVVPNKDASNMKLQLCNIAGCQNISSIKKSKLDQMNSESLELPAKYGVGLLSAGVGIGFGKMAGISKIGFAGVAVLGIASTYALNEGLKGSRYQALLQKIASSVANSCYDDTDVNLSKKALASASASIESGIKSTLKYGSLKRRNIKTIVKGKFFPEELQTALTDYNDTRVSNSSRSTQATTIEVMRAPALQASSGGLRK